jgi:hypothetical protein
MEMSLLITVVVSGIALIAFVKASGIKGKAMVLAIFLSGVMLADTNFGGWTEGTSVDAGNGLSNIVAGFVQ